jgi:peptidoglycan/LPS O-acetylase OafA/YrhL
VTFILTLTVFGIGFTPQLLLRYLSGVFLVADWHWVTFFPVEVNGPLWSISFEVTSYLLLPLGFLALFGTPGRIGQGWRTRVLWLAIIAAALLAQLAFMRLVHPGSLRRGWDYGLMGGAKFWMPNFNPFGFFAMFAIGALAAGVQARISALRHALWDVVALTSLVAIGWMLALQTSASGTESYGLFGIPHAFPWFQLGIGLALAALPSTVMVGHLLDNAAVRYVARISFGVYVWHYVVLELVRLWIAPDIDHGQMQDPLRMAWVSGLIVAISFGIADLSYRSVEAPIIAWARGLERRPAASASPTLSPASG